MAVGMKKFPALFAIFVGSVVLNLLDTDAQPISSFRKSVEKVIFQEVTGETSRFNQPVFVTGLPAGSGEYLIILEHRTGLAWKLNTMDGTKSLFGNWSDSVSDGPWEGLVCIAFHPDFTENRRFFIKHETIENEVRKTVLVERSGSESGLNDSGLISRRLLEILQPADNHNGGTIQFGPDGFLYMAMGDGGPQEDPNGFSQSGRSFLGKMLRIDIDGTSSQRPYRIPVDNPFTDRSDESDVSRKWLPEIWAYGFREPWRFSFDSQNGRLYLADVGQNRFEEISIVQRGGNYGWNIYEAWEPFSDEFRRPDENYIAPIFAYDRKTGTSITGGHVYRGMKFPHLGGTYLFADFYKGLVWGLNAGDESSSFEAVELGKCPSPVASFGTDMNGEIYVAGYDGRIYRLDFSDFSAPPFESALKE